MKYSLVSKKWQQIKRFLNDSELQKILVRDFNKLTYGRWSESLKPGMAPHEFESCDGFSDYRDRWPEFWDYVKHAVCHWFLNFNLKLALLVAPNRPWRILESKKHSTEVCRWGGTSGAYART